MDYISGEKFVGISDFIYNVGRYYENYYKYPNTFNVRKINSFPRTPIIYTTLYLINGLFAELNKVTRDVILITHNGDMCVDERLFLKKQDCVKVWYAQNVAHEDPSLHPIPIGLENSRWHKRDKKRFKLQRIAESEKQIKNLVYLNVNRQAKHNGLIRQSIYEMLSDKQYVTTEYGRNGVDFDNYLNNLYDHCFMVCPEGHGIDVHQPWESMYINTIPIQKKNKNNKGWRELPVCWLDSWDQLIDEDFLLSEYDRITLKEHDTSKLYFTYWQNEILNTT